MLNFFVTSVNTGIFLLRSLSAFRHHSTVFHSWVALTCSCDWYFPISGHTGAVSDARRSPFPHNREFDIIIPTFLPVKLDDGTRLLSLSILCPSVLLPFFLQLLWVVNFLPFARDPTQSSLPSTSWLSLCFASPWYHFALVSDSTTTLITGAVVSSFRGCALLVFLQTFGGLK